MSIEASNEVRVKDEPIYDSQSISDTRIATLRKDQPNKITNNDQSIKHESQFIPKSDSKRTREDISSDDQPNKRKRQSIVANKVKEEPLDIEIQTSKEIVVKVEEKFSAREEFTNKTSIAFLNEETTTTRNQPTTSNNSNNSRNKKSNDKKLFKSDICKKNFTYPSDLVKHKRIHSGERPYKCDVCEKNFSQVTNLITHQRIHTGERPFMCDICEKSFNQSSALKVHKRVHTGEKPYECEICKKSFSRCDRLGIHKRVHSGEKPYQCEICQKRFSQQTNLVSHLKTHS